MKTEKIPERWSSKKKGEIVLRLFKGESVETLARESKISAGKISQWRDDFISGGFANLNKKKNDPAQKKLAEAQRTIGKMAMEIELLKKNEI